MFKFHQNADTLIAELCDENIIISKTQDALDLFGELIPTDSNKGNRIFFVQNIDNALNKLMWNQIYALRAIFPGFVSTLKVVAISMINSVRLGYEKQVLEVKDIVELANR